MRFRVRKKYTSESQKDLFLQLAELKASMTVEKSSEANHFQCSTEIGCLITFESGLILEQI